MNEEKLERIVDLIKRNPTNLTHISEDVYQISPERRTRSIGEILLQLNLPSQGSTVIDIGTGFGYGAVALNALGYNAIGIESNKKKLEQGLKYWKELGLNPLVIKDYSEIHKNNSELYFMYRDAGNLSDFPESSIDLATSFFIGWYMLKRQGAFNDIGRSLKPQSELIITTEGPTHKLIPKMLTSTIVKVASSLISLPNLKLKKVQTIDCPGVYDKYVIIEKKS